MERPEAPIPLLDQVRRASALRRRAERVQRIRYRAAAVTCAVPGAAWGVVAWMDAALPGLQPRRVPGIGEALGMSVVGAVAGALLGLLGVTVLRAGAGAWLAALRRRAT